MFSNILKVTTRTMSTKTSGKRIIFTGGSGKAGRHCIPYLLSQGHKVLNVDLTEFPKDHVPEGKSVFTLKTDLTDGGQTFNALSSLFDMEEVCGLLEFLLTQCITPV